MTWDIRLSSPLKKNTIFEIVRRDDINSFAISCQSTLGAAALLLVAAVSSPAANWVALSTGLPVVAYPPPYQEPVYRYGSFWRPDEEESDFAQRLQRLHFEGTASLNWRNLGPRKPGFETQIQNEVYLADMYFGVDGPFIDGVPVQFEWNMPTSDNGQILLNQLNFSYRRIEDWNFQFGKFVLPFGRYNELYKPDQFLTVTRPLLYASPDSLDLVVRANSPRPPMTAGYTDVGGRVSYYPPLDDVWVPEEITLYVVNGMGEDPNRVRTFPDTNFLGVPGVGGGGTNIDWGHQDNNLADNNNAKSIGGRLVYSLGDVRFPWPIPEGASDLKGVTVGLSGTTGAYDLETNLNYQIYGLDWSFDYLGFNFSGEYMWETNEFLAPLESAVNPCPPGNTTCSGVTQQKDFEINRGYFVQASFPIMRTPPIGERLTGVLVFNQEWRRGPNLNLEVNQTVDGTDYTSVNYFSPTAGRVTTEMDKYTAALNYQLTDHFLLKLEYSYWVMGQATTEAFVPTATGVPLGNVDIYQTALSLVMGF